MIYEKPLPFDDSWTVFSLNLLIWFTSVHESVWSSSLINSMIQ